MVATPNPSMRQRPELVITWGKPPADFVLDDTPGKYWTALDCRGIARKLRAGRAQQARESDCLKLWSRTKIGGELTLKAPDWLYVPTVKQPSLARQSYTPHLEGANYQLQTQSCYFPEFDLQSAIALCLNCL